MSIANDLLNEVLARLRSAPVIAKTANIRRTRRISVTLDNAPAVHVIDGDELPAAQARGCRRDTTLDFRVSIFVRDDDGFNVADPIKLAVMAALNPDTPYPSNAQLTEGRISVVSDIADTDATRVDMNFRFSYARGDWSLLGA